MKTETGFMIRAKNRNRNLMQKACKALGMGKGTNRSLLTSTMGNEQATKSKYLDHLIFILDNLSPEKHVNKVFGETNKQLTSVKIAFHHMNEMKLILIVIPTRMKCSYTAVVWSHT